MVMAVLLVEVSYGGRFNWFTGRLPYRMGVIVYVVNRLRLSAAKRYVYYYTFSFLS